MSHRPKNTRRRTTLIAVAATAGLAIALLPAPAQAAVAHVDFGAVPVGQSGEPVSVTLPLATSIGEIREALIATVAATSFVPATISGPVTLTLTPEQQSQILLATIAATSDATVLGYRIDTVAVEGDADFALGGDCLGADGQNRSSCTVTGVFTPVTSGARHGEVHVGLTPTVGVDAAADALLVGITQVLGGLVGAVANVVRPFIIDEVVSVLRTTALGVINPVAELDGLGVAGGATVSSQTTSVTVVAPPPGELWIGVETPAVAFGDAVQVGSSVEAAVGDLAVKNTLGSGAQLSVTVAATSLVAADAVIPFTALAFRPGHDFSTGPSASPTAGAEQPFSGPDASPGTGFSDPVTVATAPPEVQDVWVQSGSVATLTVPQDTPAGSYHGILQYTVTG